jgi:hypothetical protein
VGRVREGRKWVQSLGGLFGRGEGRSAVLSLVLPCGLVEDERKEERESSGTATEREGERGVAAGVLPFLLCLRRAGRSSHSLNDHQDLGRVERDK